MVEFTTYPDEIVPGDIIADSDGAPAFTALAAAEAVNPGHALYSVWVQVYRATRTHLTIDGPVAVIGHVEGSPADPHGRQSIAHWDAYDGVQESMRGLNG